VLELSGRVLKVAAIVVEFCNGPESQHLENITLPKRADPAHQMLAIDMKLKVTVVSISIGWIA
jgi:hypothetical protein